MIFSTAASLLLRKSGVRISMVVAGVVRRSASITRTNCPAPPSARSSRSTEVTTMCSSPSFAAATATCSGSSGSTLRGIPVLTLQNAQARVHTSPRIITVACFLVQHSPIFGQAASSHTVLRLSARIRSRVSWKPLLTGALTRIQSGLRSRGGLGAADRSFITGPLREAPCHWQCRAPWGAAMIVPSTELAELLQGYRRFREHGWSPERQRWATLRDGQQPRVMVIACSDSRVDPAQIFDVRPGEVFVVRNVAALVPPFETTPGHHGVSAALEFAVQVLGVREIVVMGHGMCGGCKAALTRELHGA